jgi:hypothetical protein
MQKYGIWRIYAAKTGRGLESTAHARRDRLLLVSQYIAVIVLVLSFRRETLVYNDAIRSFLERASPVLDSAPARIAAVAIVVGAIAIAVRWAMHEVRAFSLPRWTFLLSILLLYAVTLVHGPLVGQLVFGTSHALEYVFFVHQFGATKYADAPPSLARTLLGDARRAPLVVLAFGALYVVSRRYEQTPTFFAFVLATGSLHYLYDGLIWKRDHLAGQAAKSMPASGTVSVSFGS